MFRKLAGQIYFAANESCQEQHNDKKSHYTKRKLTNTLQGYILAIEKDT